jgi:16S rRNA (uracil1498-N3)-methyltransferase
MPQAEFWKMRINRVYSSEVLAPGEAIVLDAASSHYLARVLRMGVGQPLVVFNGDGHDYAATIEGANKSGMELVISARLPARAESPLHSTLVQALARGERMDYALQKATELGVTVIQPVETRRTEVRLKADKLAARLAHWQKVVVSACEQCGRARIPEIRVPMGLEAWASSPEDGLRLVLAPGEDRSLTTVDAGPVVQILVGPEGGFEDQELESLQRSGVRAVSLGPRVLRTETAGPAALAVLQAIAGDF